MVTGLEILGLTLAGPAVAGQLWHYGHSLYVRITQGKQTNAVIDEMLYFQVADRWAQLETDVQLAQKVIKDDNLDDAKKERLERNFESITDLLVKIEGYTDTATGNSPYWKRYAAQRELKEIASTKKLSTKVMEFHAVVMSLRELGKDESELFLERGDFVTIEEDNRHFGLVPLSFICKGRLTRPRRGITADVQWFLFESKPFDGPHKRESVKQDIRILAEKLARAPRYTSIPTLLGFREADDGTAFELVFSGDFQARFPPTLLGLLTQQHDLPSLNDRVALCYQLAEAVLQTHTLGLVHKNIRPDNIVLPPRKEEPDIPYNVKATPYLCGWQFARKGDGATKLEGENDIKRAMYQNPSRHGVIADREYQMKDDVYSVGACMLEVLLWQPLVLSDESAGNGEVRTSPSVSFAESFDALNLEASADGILIEKLGKRILPFEIQATLISMAQKRIPPLAGTKMASLVERALTCEEEVQDDEDHSIAGKRKDAKSLAIDFVDTVLKDLREVISVL